MIKQLYELNKDIREFKYIVIYGSGRSGVQLLGELLQLGLKVDYFCDSSEKKWGTTVMNKKVLSPLELDNIKDETAILVGRAYTVEICRDLEERGFNNIFIPFLNEGIIV